MLMITPTEDATIIFSADESRFFAVAIVRRGMPRHRREHSRPKKRIKTAAWFSTRLLALNQK
jgi:hypothetical protein